MKRDGALLRSFQPGLPAPSVPARRKGKHDDDDDDDGGDGDRRGTYTTAVGFLTDKDQVMSADSAGGITVWNLTTGKAIGHNVDARRRKSFGTVIAARPGSHTVAVGTSRGEILIFAP